MCCPLQCVAQEMGFVFGMSSEGNVQGCEYTLFGSISRNNYIRITSREVVNALFPSNACPYQVTFQSTNVRRYDITYPPHANHGNCQAHLM